MGLHAEILEQPIVVRKLLKSQRTRVEDAARYIQKQDVHYGFLAARGTSENACKYASHLWGACNHLSVALATPSLFTLYDSPPQLKGALVVGVSQSGKSPDIVKVLEEGQRQGAPVIALTNNPSSPLAGAANLVLDLMAGDETAVAATKTYTAELMVIAMLSAALDSGHPERWDDLEQIPDWMEAVLKLDESLAVQAQRYREMEKCVAIGRGYNLATVLEWSLKLKELSYVVADAYSAANFQHGPLALIQPGFPVLSAAISGLALGSLQELLKKLRNQFQADLVTISDDPEILNLAQTPIPLPAGIPEWVSPLIAILPAQLFAYHLTRAKGYNTETPRSIHKVTETN